MNTEHLNIEHRRRNQAKMMMIAFNNSVGIKNNIQQKNISVLDVIRYRQWPKRDSKH